MMITQKRFYLTQEKSYKVVVDYLISLAEKIEIGKFERFENDVQKFKRNFTQQGDGQQEVELILVRPTLSGVISTAEVLEYLDSQDLIPAKIEHLLALDMAYPEIINDSCFVACLGSFIALSSGDRLYPYLSPLFNRHVLEFSWMIGGEDWWGEHCRFLAMRK